MSSRLLRPRLLHRTGAALLGLYLDAALRTTRWTIEGAEHLAPYSAGGGVIVACWHERLALAPAFRGPARRSHPGRGVAALASRHRDGQLIAGVLSRFGVRVVRGSTGSAKPGHVPADRGGAASLRALLHALAGGDAVVITPDGPRGPRRRAAPGTAQLAALSGAAVLPVSGQVRHRLTLASWDRMVIPLPFGRGALVCEPPINVGRHEADARHAEIEAALSRAADRADLLCR